MILITGSDGFMGRWLAKKLGKAISFDQRQGKDITDLKQVLAIPKVSTLFHLAGISFVPDAAADPHAAFQVNTLGTLNICELARKHGGRIIFPSTYVYGQPQYLPVDERHPVAPSTIYAESKLLAERVIQRYAEEYGLGYAILRFFNVYGPGQSEKFLIPKIVAGAKKGGIALQDKTPRRDFTFITDAVEAYLKAAMSKKSGIYNIGSGKSYSVWEIVEKVRLLSKKKLKVTYGKERRKNEILDCAADAGKARKELGWIAKVGIDDGLKQMMRDG